MCLYVLHNFSHLKSDWTCHPCFLFTVIFQMVPELLLMVGAKNPAMQTMALLQEYDPPNRKAEGPDVCRPDSCLRPQPRVAAQAPPHTVWVLPLHSHGSGIWVCAHPFGFYQPFPYWQDEVFHSKPKRVQIF